MNQISFHPNLDGDRCIRIDGHLLPVGYYINWGCLISAGEHGGDLYICTCSCGCSECGGTEAFSTFSGDGIVAWRTYDHWIGDNYVFDKRQYLEAVLQALTDLDWLYFFHGEDEHGNQSYCPSSPNGYGKHIASRLAWASGVFQRMQISPVVEPSPLDRLLGAICRGDLNAADRVIGAGADVNDVRIVPHPWRDGDTEESLLRFALVFAPEPVRHDFVRLLIRNGADVNLAKSRDEYLMKGMLRAGNSDAVTDILSRLWKTGENLRYIEEGIEEEFDRNLRSYYYYFYNHFKEDEPERKRALEASNRLSRYASRRIKGSRGLHANLWKRMESYARLASRMGFPSSRHLMTAMEMLQQARNARGRYAAA